MSVDGISYNKNEVIKSYNKNKYDLISGASVYNIGR